jgi:hypothetical protein
MGIASWLLFLVKPTFRGHRHHGYIGGCAWSVTAEAVGRSIAPALLGYHIKKLLFENKKKTNSKTGVPGTSAPYF